MDKFDIIIFMLLLFYIYVFIKYKYYRCNKHNDEYFSTSITPIASINPTDPTKDTKTMTRQIDLLEDKSFDDVIFYRSEPIWGEETGLQKCLNNCNGTCVEFGVTGDCMCFPKN